MFESFERARRSGSAHRCRDVIAASTPAAAERLPTRPIGECGRLRVRLSDARFGPIANAVREHGSQMECLICGEHSPIVVRTAEVQCASVVPGVLKQTSWTSVGLSRAARKTQWFRFMCVSSRVDSADADQ